MKNLVPGLRKFSDKVFPTQKPLFESLSQGQRPHTLFITCSDSRIDPNLLTQTLPGELFVVRNAGNIVPPYGNHGGEEAAIEFAVDGLKVSNIVVCGHSQCGAMAGLIDKVDVSGLPSVSRWLKYAEATKKRMKNYCCDEHRRLHHTIEENVLAQADNLKSHPAVWAGLRNGTIRIYGWVYHFETGEVSIYDNQSKRFQLSSEIGHELSAQDTSRFAL